MTGGVLTAVMDTLVFSKWRYNVMYVGKGGLLCRVHVGMMRERIKWSEPL